MKLFHNIGQSPNPNSPQISANYNTVLEVLSCQEDISFDGVYLNVYQEIIKNRSKFENFIKEHDIYLFVIGRFIGSDNSFDVGMPKEKFCGIDQLIILRDLGCILGWHTQTHRDLTTLSEAAIRNELETTEMFSRYLAYPYGKFNNKVLRIAQELGFLKAWSVNQGNNTQFQLNREYV